jgi:hypothetical protein
MPHQYAAHRKAVTWWFHRDLVAAVKAAAEKNGETMLAFATRALERELAAAGETESEAP